MQKYILLMTVYRLIAKLISVVHSKPPISSSKIRSITNLALKHVKVLFLEETSHAQYYKNVVHSVEKFIAKVWCCLGCQPQTSRRGQNTSFRDCT